jgi:CarD family transcriptional regulator
MTSSAAATDSGAPSLGAPSLPDQGVLEAGGAPSAKAKPAAPSRKPGSSRPAAGQKPAGAFQSPEPARSVGPESATPPTLKANTETMEVEKTTIEMQEPLSPAADPVAADDAAADTADRDTPPSAIPPSAMPPSAELVEEDEPEEAPVARRVETRSEPTRTMNHGRPQMSGPAPRIPSKAETFVEGDYVVYPTHGVGKVEKINVEDIAGHRLELIHITFEENRMTLRVPVAKARSAGLRKLATRQMFDEALAILKGRARIKRTMWSRRAQEYEAKINSGDPLAIAEVVRDLHRNAGQPDQSFSERQIYEAAMDRLGAELAALDRTDKLTAANKLAEFLKTI